MKFFLFPIDILENVSHSFCKQASKQASDSFGHLKLHFTYHIRPHFLRYLLVASFIGGLTLSESLWAAGTCLPFGAAYYCDIDHVNHPTLTACQIACDLPVTSYTLTLNTAGTGNGTVTGGGTYTGGTIVDLIATPDANSTFAGWSTGCSSGMTLTADTTCTATFDLIPTTPAATTPAATTSPLPQDMSVFVQVDGTGSGRVTSPESGLSCQTSDCQEDAKGELVCATNCTTIVKTGSNLTLIPQADSNSIFSSWGGNVNCADGQLTTITEGTLCIAYFRRLYQLTIEVQGPGNVTGNRPGYDSKKPINCGVGQTQCQNTYESGTQDSLQAQPLGNALFQGWGGDCSGLQNPLILNLSKDMTCQAIFLAPTAVKLDQIIMDFSPATPAEVNTNATLTATGGASGNPVTFASTTPTVCSVSGSTVNVIATGTCTVTADQAGNDQYYPAPQVMANMTVNNPVKLDQTITHFSPATPVVINSDATLTATGGGSGNPVTFASTTPTVCTVSGNTVNLVNVGTCVVTADQVGNDLYNPAPQVMANITVTSPAKLDQLITIFSSTGTVGDQFILMATGGGSGNPVTFVSITPTVCTVSSNLVTLLIVGTCTLTADQAGNDLYNPAPQMIANITVQNPAKQPQLITDLVATGKVGEHTTLKATGGNSGNPVTFATTTPAVCAVSGNVVTFLAVGTCTIIANQVGNDEYQDASPEITQIEVHAQGSQTSPPIADSTTTPVSTVNSLNCAMTDTAGITTIRGLCDARGKVFSTPIVIDRDATLSNAVFASSVDNHGWISNSKITSTGEVKGGILTGRIDNQGIVQDFEFKGSSFTGGTVGGVIQNTSTVGGCLQDVTLLPNTTLTGGCLDGTLKEDPNFPAVLDNVKVKGEGLVTEIPPPEDTGVLSNAQLNNLDAETFGHLSLETMRLLTAADLSQISPEAFRGLTAEQLAALSEEAIAALTPEQMAAISPATMTGLTAEQLAVLDEATVAVISGEQLAPIPPDTFSTLTPALVTALSANALASLTPSQFLYVPTSAVGGLTAQNLGGISTDIISRFTPDHLAALPTDQFQQLPNTDIGKWLNNLDQTRIEGAQMAPLIPSDWQWNSTTGALIPPVGTVLQLKPLSTTEAQIVPVVLPELPNLKTSFGIAGEGEQSVEESMQLTLDQVDLSQFMLSQDEQGILQVRGTGEFEGVNFAFIPDVGEMIQVDSEIPIGLETIEGGFFQMTTPDSQQFKITPAPTDPKGLSQVLGGGAVIVGKRGDVFMEVPTSLRQVGKAREVVMFDPLVEPAPAEYCEDVAGETVCDFDNAPLENRPGIRTVPTTGTRVRDVPHKKVVYPNGTAQLIRPTVLSPDTFINVGAGFDSVEKVQLNANGTFIVTHQGNKYLVTPNFGPRSRPVGASEQIEPTIELDATTGHITYTIMSDKVPQTTTGTKSRPVRDGEAREVLEFDSLIEPVPEENCEENKGEIICETP